MDLASAVLGGDKVEYLMQVAVVGAAEAACKGLTKALSTAVIAAAKQACGTADQRNSTFLRLHGISHETEEIAELSGISSASLMGIGSASGVGSGSGNSINPFGGKRRKYDAAVGSLTRTMSDLQVDQKQQAAAGRSKEDQLTELAKELLTHEEFAAMTDTALERACDTLREALVLEGNLADQVQHLTAIHSLPTPIHSLPVLHSLPVSYPCCTAC